MGGDGTATGSQLLSAGDQDALPIIRLWLGSEDDRETLLAIVIQMTEISSTEWRYRTPQFSCFSLLCAQETNSGEKAIDNRIPAHGIDPTHCTQ